MKFFTNCKNYFARNPDQYAIVAYMLGIGSGFLMTYPIAQTHPLRWGGLFFLMATVGYVWAGFQKTTKGK